jgi:hypothetical protein
MVLPKKGGDMTAKSIQEYAAIMRQRYIKADKKEKGKILDEFIKVTGYHRKSAIRALLKITKPPNSHRGRLGKYSAVLQPLRSIWEASDRLCSRRLQPFIPEMIQVLRRQGEIHIDSNIQTQLTKLSSSTIDRMLRPYRQRGGRKPLSATQRSKLLKSSIPIRTFADWQENQPGFLEIDTVAHCGESVAGFYLNTLCGVDVASSWTECVPVWGKGQVRVRSAAHRLRQRLPFPLLGLDSDSGSEFLNYGFSKYCQEEKIAFTVSRPNKKNDSCYVEQKNGNIVRRLVGYDRYSSKAAYQSLERLYIIVRQYTNFFQPTMKLIAKTRQGAKVHKVYARAQTPYQRLLNSSVLDQAKKAELAATYGGLNPVRLLRQINDTLDQLWKLAEHHNSSVTRIMTQ